MKISWLGNSAFRIADGKVLYIDPYQISKIEPANIIFITHEHYDHCSIEDVRKIADPKTVIVTTASVKEKLRGVNAQFLLMVPGKAYSIGDVKVEAVPAYNVNKFRSPNVPYHPESGNNLGFVITVDGVKIYHAGDTDEIPGMASRVKDVDIVFVPVSGSYVMTPAEAAKAVNRIVPKIAVPMHYGGFVGTRDDAIKFKSMAKCEVRILEKE